MFLGLFEKLTAVDPEFRYGIAAVRSHSWVKGSTCTNADLQDILASRIELCSKAIKKEITEAKLEKNNRENTKDKKSTVLQMIPDTLLITLSSECIKINAILEAQAKLGCKIQNNPLEKQA